MPDSLKQEARSVFLQLADLADAERVAALSRLCSDNPALRAEVEALLRADGMAGAFLANPAVRSVAAEQPGASIGRYKLLEKIGEGGMGTVWMAEQKEPVKRRVALKIVKLGMDTKQVVARFEAERQALALMDHPHIAKVLDAGATEAGRPYFVMEYIKGIPILEYCDQAKVDTRSRLLLFTSVCHAIQHAHQKGIIHRDIKPSNVLVTLHDGVPVPKVIDFGIAKATNAELTTKTLFTEHQQMLGTPAYMSPEQAEMSGLDIDTRSDIYSLGVLLYELLTGTTPFDTKELLAKGFAEMMRTIREVEPHKPSTRISTLGDTGTRTAQLRHVDVKQLGTLLRGDLDWIVMKCLEKDRTRRYETANGLAADIKRHLHDEPVTAGAPSPSYRLRKFMKRNRGQVIAGGIVAMALVLGVIGTTIGMLRALGERRRANDEATKATLAAGNEAKAKTEAQENERRAVLEAARAKAAKDDEATSRQRAESIGAFVAEALKSSDPENQGGDQDTTILQAMDRAILDLDSGRFRDDPATKASLQVTIGAILRNNGRLADAEALLSQALETALGLHGSDSPEAALAMNELALARHHLGRNEEARQLLVQVLDINRRRHPGDHTTVSMAMVNLAQTVPRAEAEPLLRDALAMDRRLFPSDSREVCADLANLGSLHFTAGRTAQAEQWFAETLEMAMRLHPGDHPSVAKALDNLGKARGYLGRRDEALDLLTKALAMRRRLFKGPHPDLATGLGNLAQLQLEEGRLAEAERLYAEALEMRQQIFKGDHEVVASSVSVLADVLLEMERNAEAERHSATALQMRRRLHPGDHLEVVAALTQLGSAQAAQGRSEEAWPLLAKALEMVKRLAPSDSPATAISLDNLGKSFQRAGRLDDAEALLAQALAMRERIYQGDHADLAKGLSNLAAAIAARGRHAEAEALQRRSLEMYQRLFGADHPRLASVMSALAALLRDAGRPAEAEPYAVKAVESYRRLVSSPSREGGDNNKLAAACFTLGTIREALGRWPETVQPYEEATAMVRRLLPATHPNVLHGMTRLATSYYFVGAVDKALPLFEEAMKGEVATFGREHPDTLMTIGNVGANYAAVGRYAEAVPLLEEARSHAKRYPQLGFVHLQLLDAYTHLADSATEGFAAKARSLADELVAETRATSPNGSPELAQGLAMVGLSLVVSKAWDAAEPLLREALEIREKAQPDAWTTFNTKSVLGGALLGQKRWAEAEPLLLAGYRGMQERRASIPPQGSTRIPEALERLVRLYEATGNAAEAAAWRRELPQPPQSRPATDGAKR